MNTTSVLAHAAVSSSAFRRPAFFVLGLIGVLAFAFFYVYATPYFTFDEATFPRPYYWPRRVPLWFHIAGGTGALLVGPVQLWLGITDLAPEWHRRLGMIYITCLAIGSAAAFYLLTYTELGLAFQTGIFGLALAWIVTTSLAFIAVRRGLIEQHREWMTRSYVVTTGFTVYRVVMFVLPALHISTSRLEQRSVAAWFCWAVPLLICEALIQGRKIFKSPTY